MYIQFRTAAHHHAGDPGAGAQQSGIAERAAVAREGRASMTAPRAGHGLENIGMEGLGPGGAGDDRCRQRQCGGGVDIHRETLDQAVGVPARPLVESGSGAQRRDRALRQRPGPVVVECDVLAHPYPQRGAYRIRLRQAIEQGRRQCVPGAGGNARRPGEFGASGFGRSWCEQCQQRPHAATGQHEVVGTRCRTPSPGELVGGSDVGSEAGLHARRA